MITRTEAVIYEVNLSVTFKDNTDYDHYYDEIWIQEAYELDNFEVCLIGGITMQDTDRQKVHTCAAKIFTNLKGMLARPAREIDNEC